MNQALFVFSAVAIFGFGVEPSVAQTRVFVSGLGTDANPCSLGAPCRSFQHAHDAVNAGGEVVALDAAGYGSVTITKSVAITAIGIEASITSSSTTPNAIVISAGANDVVTLRGLTLFSGTSTGDGIGIVSAKSVTIRNCAISGFPSDRIGVGPSGNVSVELRDVSADNNGQNGLNITPSGAGNVSVVAIDSLFSGNGHDGILVNGSFTASQGTIKVALTVVADSSVNGLSVVSANGQAQPVVMVNGSKLMNNSLNGIFAGNSSVQVFVERTQLSGNGTAWLVQNGAVVSSYKDNVVNGNGNDALNGVIQITTQ